MSKYGKTSLLTLAVAAVMALPLVVEDAQARGTIQSKSKIQGTTGQTASSSSSDDRYKTDRKVAAQGLRERTFKRLTRVHELIGEEKYAEALSTIEPLLEGTKGLDYEYAVVLQTLGHIHAAQAHYDKAIETFKEAVTMDVLPNHAHYQLMLAIAQLYVATDRFREGLDYLDVYFGAVIQAPPRAWELKAIAHYQLQELRNALNAIDTAIALSDDPKRQWYELKLGLHFEMKEYVESAETLEILVSKWPDKKQYWTQLSGLYVELKRDDDALAVLALAHREGLLDKEKEWLSLANLYMYRDVPYKAAEILQEGIDVGMVEPTKKNYESLGNAWYQAREYDKAIDAFVEAAKVWDEDGKMDLQAAYLLVDQERWEEAEAALAEAVRKGGLRDMGNANILLGMTYFELGRREAAKRAFREAKKYPKSAEAAQEWLNHIAEREAKEARQLSMAE